MERVIVFPYVELRMAATGRTRKSLAKELGISYGSIENKLRGLTPFTVEEAIILKKSIGACYPIELLFIRAEQRC